MKLYPFELHYTMGRRRISLRELNGYDELMVDEDGVPGLLRLLNRLIAKDGYENGAPVRAEKIAVADRDYLLAGVYQYTYGSTIESAVGCRACSTRFDLHFSLGELVSFSRQKAMAADQDADGYFIMESQRRFRLPDGEDELATGGLPPEEAVSLLLQRCLSGSEPTAEVDSIQEMMEQVAPILMMDLRAVCPECGQGQDVQFDMQSYLLARMKNERRRVAMEIHCLASMYRWSHQEILDLPRSLRKTYAGLIGLE